MIRELLAYLGWDRSTEVPVKVEDLGCGAGRVPCFECEGSGDWTRFHPDGDLTVCVTCKGTGFVLISI